MHYTYVVIPHDTSAALREGTAVCANIEVDTLKTAASLHFSQNPPGFDASLRQPVSVEITLLSVPKAPDFLSVSMYSDPAGEMKGLPENSRATALLRAAGHASTMLRGDVFLSRVLDNEATDEWARRPITVAEADPASPWVADAAAAIKARGGSGFSSSSMLQQLRGDRGSVVFGGGGGGGGYTGGGLEWARSDPSNEASCSWRRAPGSAGEVEVRQPLPPGVFKAKDLVVTMARTRLGVAMRAQTQTVSGPLGGIGAALACPIDVESSSWTVADGKAVVFSLVLAGAWAGNLFAQP